MQVPKFNLEDMCPNPFIFICGKKGSKKTAIIKDILRQNSSSRKLIVSCYEDTRHEYSAEFYDAQIYDNGCNIKDNIKDVVTNFISEQEDLLTNISDGSLVNHQSIIVLDDVFSTTQLTAASSILSLIVEKCKRNNITCVITMQFPLGINIEVRSSFDYVFLCNEDYISNKKRLYDHYAGTFPSYQSFDSAFMQLTRNHSCEMVIRQWYGDKSFLTIHDRVRYYDCSHSLTNDIAIDMGDKLPISEFKLSDMADISSTLICGPYYNDSISLVRSIIGHYCDVPRCIIVSSNENVGQYFCNDTYRIEVWNSSNKNELNKQLRKFILQQKLNMHNSTSGSCADHKDFCADPRSIIFFDNQHEMVKTISKNSLLMDIFLNGRHKKIILIATMQYDHTFLPDVRANFDHVHLLADDNHHDLRRKYSHYGGMFPTFASFQQVFRQLTNDHMSMVIKNRGCRQSLLDKVKFYQIDHTEEEHKDSVNVTLGQYTNGIVIDSDDSSSDEESDIGYEQGRSAVCDWETDTNMDIMDIHVDDTIVPRPECQKRISSISVHKIGPSSQHSMCDHCGNSSKNNVRDMDDEHVTCFTLISSFTNVVTNVLKSCSLGSWFNK